MGSGGDGGPAKLAEVSAVYGIAADAVGNVYFADPWNDRVCKIDAGGTITTIAGAGEEGAGRDGGPAVAAQLERPQDLAIDQSGNLYIADTAIHRYRNSSHPTGGPRGVIATIAGSGEEGFSGDGGPATDAELNEPSGVAVGSDSNVYIFDMPNRVVRRVDPAGTITTVAGDLRGHGLVRSPATSFFLPFPSAVATGPRGGLRGSRLAHPRPVAPQGPSHGGRLGTHDCRNRRRPAVQRGDDHPGLAPRPAGCPRPSKQWAPAGSRGADHRPSRRGRQATSAEAGPPAVLQLE